MGLNLEGKSHTRCRPQSLAPAWVSVPITHSTALQNYYHHYHHFNDQKYNIIMTINIHGPDLKLPTWATVPATALPFLIIDQSSCIVISSYPGTVISSYKNTRSLGALRAPTSSWRPFGPHYFLFMPFATINQF